MDQESCILSTHPPCLSGFLDTPAIILGEGDTIALWYLPSAISQAMQDQMVGAIPPLSNILTVHLGWDLVTSVNLLWRHIRLGIPDHWWGKFFLQHHAWGFSRPPMDFSTINICFPKYVRVTGVHMGLSPAEIGSPLDFLHANKDPNEGSPAEIGPPWDFLHAKKDPMGVSPAEIGPPQDFLHAKIDQNESFSS
ncbi:hypothetical protein F5J12DRAFT_783844 [Pisolithus orientalis]|uniref:uncharacterized protein n=1 Tax=Pisolithus orientalis TaxID=936130 RepID=UPI0022258EC5|nr:uncharacterized protein F5J12DRAFT_783844 [Pisolithus orientalis]KAI6002363.1 hypothetical protein F5J12DRAFT_783844 [Pisolithus orientalis]